jgi:hypothetical protein
VPKTFLTNIKDSAIGPKEIRLPRSHPTRETNRRNDIDAGRVRNFLDAVKSRKDSTDPVEVGHSTDEGVNRVLQRPMRASWRLL